MRRFALMALLIIGTMSTPARGTVAYLTSAASSSGSTFSAGTVTLATTNASDTSISTVFNTNANLYPGWTTFQLVRVKNNGNLTYRYDVTSTASAANSLAPALQLTVANRTVGTAGCNATDFTSTNYVERYGSFATGSALANGNATEHYLFHNLDAGNGGITFASSVAKLTTVAPTAYEDLCFRVVLPSAADPKLQAAGALTVTFKFVAVQASGL